MSKETIINTLISDYADYLETLTDEELNKIVKAGVLILDEVPDV